jgi:hypothetical protein
MILGKRVGKPGELRPTRGPLWVTTFLVLCVMFGCSGRGHLHAKAAPAEVSADSTAIVYSSRYGVSIDTTVGQLRKWMWTESGGTEAYITVPFHLSFSEKLLILAEADSVRFFDLPDAPPAPEEINGTITQHCTEPSNYYSLKISVGHRVNTIHWQTESYGASEVFDRMQRMGHCIDRLIWSKDEYRKLPRGHMRI